MAKGDQGALRQPGTPGPDTGPDALFRIPAAAAVEKGTADPLRLAIRLTTARPELRPLCAGVRFAVDPALNLPFCAVRGERIVLHPDTLADPLGAALILRHALELALWQRLSRPELLKEQRRARACLTALVAARYGAVLPARARAQGLAALPAWLAAAHEMLAADDADWARLPAELLRLEGEAPEAGPSPASDQLMGRLQALAAPSEHLLLSGGGSRLRLDPETGRNPYGCSPLPEPDSLAFASSTASTISAPAHRAVERLRQELIEAGLADRLPQALDRTIAGIRRGILEAAGALDLAGVEVVLTPSGTDGEYAALHLARRLGTERLVNLVIAPDETGRGVRDAAQGRHFASATPAGEAVAPGEPLAGVRPEAVTLETVEIRAPDGTPRRPAAIDAEVKARALRAVARGARCLVHLLEVSKSGLCAPGLEAVQDLIARHGERIDVVVDACQMREGRASLRSCLEAGWMVLLTGSKFAMGPPFSGALLVPAQLARQAAGLEPLPAGYGHYFTRPDWPDAWQALTAALPASPNLGLLCRWHAALFEMQACRAVPEASRRRIVERLGAAIRQAIDASPSSEAVGHAAVGVEPAGRKVVGCEAVGCEATGCAPTGSEPRECEATGREAAARGGQGPPSIFSFRLLRRDGAGGSRPLEVEAAREVWRWLREDLSERLPAGSAKPERRLAALVCQVGQPVRLGTIASAPLGATLGVRPAKPGAPPGAALGARPAEPGAPPGAALGARSAEPHAPPVSALGVRPAESGAPIGALRICIGARQVTEVAFDPALGKTEEQRLARQIGRVRMVLEKADLIARHYAHLSASAPTSTG